MYLPLAYIDPGTGSILFSVLIGFATAFFFLAKTIMIKIKYKFSDKDASEIASHRSFVIYNEGKQYCNVFKSIVEEFENRKIALTYLTSAENDPVLSEGYQHVAASYIGTGNKAFASLNFLEADICLMTTPSIEVYQLKRSKGVKHYSHILHDTGDATFYKLFGIDWFDSILLSGEYQKADIRELERIRQTPEKKLEVVGCTYLDVLLEKKSRLVPEENPPFTVLVSPSWGPGSLLTFFGEKLLEPLSKTGWRIIVRPHPQSRQSEAEVLNRLETAYGGSMNFEWDYSPENLSSLSKADIMLSDFSGIIFDYVFLFEKPVLYSNTHFDMEMYDASDIDRTPWKFAVLETFGMELKDEDLPDIKSVIEKAIENRDISAGIKKAKETAWEHIGESGRRVVDFLIEEQQKIALPEIQSKALIS